MPKRKKYKTKLNVRQIAEAKGIENAHQFHVRTNLSIPRSVKIWDGKDFIKISPLDIDMICNTLPCKLKDIFKRVPIEDNQSYAK